MNEEQFSDSNLSLTILVLLLMDVISFSFPGTALAASAVAFDGGTSAYAYAHNLQTEEEAKARALGGCYKRGGRSCNVIVSCSGGGYGAIVMRRLPGKSIEAIGASCGAASPEVANQGALEACHRSSKRCGRPTVGWQDTLPGE